MANEVVKRLETQCKADPDGEHYCPACNEVTPNIRFTLLNTIFCKKCTAQPKKVYGCVEYSHKTAGVLMITESYDAFKEMKKTANERR